MDMGMRSVEIEGITAGGLKREFGPFYRFPSVFIRVPRLWGDPYGQRHGTSKFNGVSQGHGV